MAFFRSALQSVPTVEEENRCLKAHILANLGIQIKDPSENTVVVPATVGKGKNIRWVFIAACISIGLIFLYFLCGQQKNK